MRGFASAYLQTWIWTVRRCRPWPANSSLRSTSGAPHVRHDAEARFYQQLYRDPNLDVWLICWVDGQSTGYHDHDRSSGAVCVSEGILLEDWFRVEEDGWVRERTTDHGPGGRFDFDAPDIHGVRHPGHGDPRATSIHLYSPALWRMGHYESGPRGMRRVGMTYADDSLARPSSRRPPEGQRAVSTPWLERRGKPRARRHRVLIAPTAVPVRLRLAAGRFATPRVFEEARGTHPRGTVRRVAA